MVLSSMKKDFVERMKVKIECPDCDVVAHKKSVMQLKYATRKEVSPKCPVCHELMKITKEA